MNIERLPSTANVLKNARFFVSNGFSCVQSGDRDNGSLSPVNEELSTLKLCDDNTRISKTEKKANTIFTFFSSKIYLLVFYLQF
jgi:hypothetical protein